MMGDFGRRQAAAKAEAKADGVKVDRIAVARAWHAELVDNGLAGLAPAIERYGYLDHLVH